MAEWSKKFEKCNSCSSEEWSHKAKGFCYKCYPLIKKLETVKKWEAGNEATYLTVGPVDKDLITYLVGLGELDTAKESLVRQIEARLYLFKKYNSPGDVDGIAIEYLLERIGYITSNISDTKLFHGAVTRYNDKFDNTQRQIIYKDLAYILINRRFKLEIWRDIM